MNDKLAEIFELAENTKCEKIDEDKYYLSNHLSNSCAYISSTAFLIVEQIDGKKTVKQITDILTNENSTNDDYRNVSEFISTQLRYSGFLKSEQSKKSSMIRFSRLIVNEALTNKISTVLHHLFSKKFVIPFYIIALVIVGLSINRYSDILILTKEQPNYPGMIFAAILLFFVHELGHTSAMKKYNLSAKGIGVGFYFFTPVMYADVSESWKLPNKQRVVVDIGGFHFQFMITLLYFLCAIIFESPTLLYVVSLSLFISIFNFNPFIKSDFYWGISDFFNIPNLREKADKEFFKFFTSKRSCKISLPLAFYGFLCYLFVLAVIVFIVRIFCLSINDIVSGNYELTYWNIERDILVIISLLFFSYEGKKMISKYY